MHARKLAGLLATGGALFAISAAPAGADPKGGEAIPLTCDNGNSYTVVTNGEGEFTPAHDVDSNSTFVPLAFGEFHGTVTDPGGNVVATIDEPAIAKGQSNRNGKGNVTCTLTFSGSEDGFTFSGTGTVTGFITPRGAKA
jgi:hypothetical protein